MPGLWQHRFLNSEAKKAVMVVPIFAPRMYGKALFKFTFPIATTGTASEVVTELDCTAPVNIVPQENALKVLLKTKDSYWFLFESINNW